MLPWTLVGLDCWVVDALGSSVGLDCLNLGKKWELASKKGYNYFPKLKIKPMVLFDSRKFFFLSFLIE